MNYSNTPKTKKDELSDNQLVHLVQQQDQEAFTCLYQRYLPVVYRHVRQSIPELDVDDMTQEIFIAMLKALPTFRQEAQFSTWLYTLIRRRIADYYRHRGRQQDLKNVALSAAVHYPAPATGGHDKSALLREALLRLPDHYQEVILLRFVHELSFKEVAQAQGQSLEATKSLFRRAMTALRDEMSNTDE